MSGETIGLKHSGGQPNRIGIIIVTFNGLELTRACLTSLRNVAYPHSAVVVVDNGSTDGSVQLLPKEFPEIHFLPQLVNTGFTGGNNTGILWCLEKGFDAVLLLNNDTEVEPAFLAHMAQHLKTQDLVAPQIRSLRQRDVFVGHIGDFEWNRGVLSDHFYRPSVLQTASKAFEVGMAGGCCLLIPRAVFESVGLLDTTFFLYYEDTDFVIRARASGFRLVYEPQAIIYHLGSSSSGGCRISPLTLYYNTRNRLYIMSKYRAIGLGFLLYFFLTRLLYTAHYMISGRWSLLQAMWRGIRDYYAGRMGYGEYEW